MNKNRFLALGSICIVLSLLYSSCKKETETITITETVIQRDTIINVVRDTIINTDTITVSSSDTITNFMNDTATMFIVVRHVEKSNFGSDPVLSTAGQLRANSLRDILTKVNLDAVYSTNFNRTRQTAAPTATEQGLAILNYDPFSLSPFVDSVLTNYNQGTVLVVGHSNTTPSLLNELVGSNIYTNIPESEHDNLYIVSVFEKGRSEVLHLKY